MLPQIQTATKTRRPPGHLQGGWKSRVFQLCRLEKCIESSYYKASLILFIYLVGRACIPGIFGWFVLLSFLLLLLLCVSFFFWSGQLFFSFLKRPDHPVGDHLPLGDKPALVSLPEPACSELHRTLCKPRPGQCRSGLFNKARLPFPRAQVNYRGLGAALLDASQVCRRNDPGLWWHSMSLR